VRATRDAWESFSSAAIISCSFSQVIGTETAPGLFPPAGGESKPGCRVRC
jgi:hypothetical protein